MATKSTSIDKGIVPKDYNVRGGSSACANKKTADKCNYVDKKFGFCEVTWKIKNYCTVQAKEEKTFSSPVFYVRGYQLTKWKMAVKRTFVPAINNYRVFFILQRLELGGFSKNVTADCVLEYNDHQGHTLEMDFCCMFEAYAENSVSFMMRKAGVTHTSEKHSGVFELKLQILVHFSDITETIPPCENKGLKELSENILAIYDDGIIDDLKISAQEGLIPVHRAILYCRIPNIDYKEKISSNEDVISFEDWPTDHLANVLRFLYSGNIKYAVAVTEPAVNVFRLAKIFDIEPIMTYYNPDEISLFTVLEAEEYSAKWTIEDFSQRTEVSLLSPVMTNQMKDVKWRIQIYPVSIKSKDHLDIALLYEVTSQKDICVEFFLEGKSEYFSRSFHRRISVDSRLNVFNFIERSELHNFMKDESLTIGLRLRVSTDVENTSVDESKSAYKYLSEQKNYVRFSEDILSLYNDQKFTDIPLIIVQQNIATRLHEYILHVRCTGFLYALQSRDMSYLSTIKENVIVKLITFMYSGRLAGDICLDDTFLLYEVSTHFNFANLGIVIIERLRNNISELNARDILNFATSQNIDCLRATALNILENVN